MRMSCNGCRVLRKGCNDSCVLRPCLHWIRTPESQANATAFLAKFYGRTGLTNLISNGPEHLRPDIFRSLLYDACGRMLDPIYGSVGLVWSGNWAVCQAGVDSILRGNSASHFVPMEAMAGELHRVKAKGRFKGVPRAKRKRKERERAAINNLIDSSCKSGGRCEVKNSLQRAANNGKSIIEQEQDEFGAADQVMIDYSHNLICNLKTSEPEAEAAACNGVELELTLGSQGQGSQVSTSSPALHKLFS